MQVAIWVYMFVKDSPGCGTTFFQLRGANEDDVPVLSAV